MDDKLVKVNLAIPQTLKLRVKKWALESALLSGNREQTLQQAIISLLESALVASDDAMAHIAKQEYLDSQGEEKKAAPSPRRQVKAKPAKKKEGK